MGFRTDGHSSVHHVLVIYDQCHVTSGWSMAIDMADNTKEHVKYEVPLKTVCDTSLDVNNRCLCYAIPT